MTASLRPIIAEILIHTAPASDRDPGAWLGQLFGAETLYWCDEHELGGLPSRADMVDELEELRALVDDIESSVADTKGKLADRIREILAT